MRDIGHLVRDPRITGEKDDVAIGIEGMVSAVRTFHCGENIETLFFFDHSGVKKLLRHAAIQLILDYEGDGCYHIVPILSLRFFGYW